MSYKVLIPALNVQNYGDQGVTYTYGIFDLSVNQVVYINGGLLRYGTDIASFDPTVVFNTLQAQIMAWQTTSGYSFTVADLFYNGISLMTPAQATAAIAASQPRVYSSPTFAQITSVRQLSATREAQVSYDIDATVSLTLLAGQSVTATLKYADNSGMSTNVVTASSQIIQSSGILGLTNTQTLKLSAGIPAGKYCQVTFAVTGGATTPSAVRATQDILI